MLILFELTCFFGSECVTWSFAPALLVAFCSPEAVTNHPFGSELLSQWRNKQQLRSVRGAITRYQEEIRVRSCPFPLQCVLWLRTAAPSDTVAQLVEHPLQTQRPQVRTPSGAQETFVRVFPSRNCCADSLSVCVQTPVCIPTHMNDHLSQMFLVLLTGFEPRVFGSRVRPTIYQYQLSDRFNRFPPQLLVFRGFLLEELPSLKMQYLFGTEMMGRRDLLLTLPLSKPTCFKPL